MIITILILLCFVSLVGFASEQLAALAATW